MRHGTFALEESEKAGGQTRDRTRAQESSVRSNAGAMPPQKIFFPDSNTIFLINGHAPSSLPFR